MAGARPITETIPSSGHCIATLKLGFLIPAGDDEQNPTLVSELKRMAHIQSILPCIRKAYWTLECSNLPPVLSHHMSSSSRLSEAERKAASKLSKEKYRGKPGVLEREREQAVIRSRKYRANVRERLAMSRSTPSSPPVPIEPIDLANVMAAYEYFARPIDAAKYSTSFAHFCQPQSNSMDGFFNDFEPTLESCGAPANCYPMSDAEVDTYVDRMVGRFAKEQVNLAEQRFSSVDSANDHLIEEIRQEWEGDLAAAVGVAQRWLPLNDASSKHPKTAHSRFVMVKYTWICQKVYFLAEAVDFLSNGKAAYLAAWRDGRFRASKAFLVSKFL